jgi:hypothetical protein
LPWQSPNLQKFHLGKIAVGGQDYGPPLIPSGNQLEKEMGAMTIDRDIADFIDDKQFGLAVELERFFDPVFGIGF